MSQVAAQTVGLGGTLYYLPPEVFADNTQGYAGDMWAVGYVATLSSLTLIHDVSAQRNGILHVLQG